MTLQYAERTLSTSPKRPTHAPDSFAALHFLQLFQAKHRPVGSSRCRAGGQLRPKSTRETAGHSAAEMSAWATTPAGNGGQLYTADCVCQDAQDDETCGQQIIALTEGEGGQKSSVLQRPQAAGQVKA